MPYKRKGKVVYHYKGGKWRIKQVCKSEAAAKAAIRLLYGIEYGMVPRSRKKRK